MNKKIARIATTLVIASTGNILFKFFDQEVLPLLFWNIPFLFVILFSYKNKPLWFHVTLPILIAVALFFSLASLNFMYWVIGFLLIIASLFILNR